MMMRKKKHGHAKEPYDGYTLPKSSERGQPFIDFNKVRYSMRVKSIKKRREEI
jgi:hypothetical protein